MVLFFCVSARGDQSWPTLCLRELPVRRRLPVDGVHTRGMAEALPGARARGETAAVAVTRRPLSRCGRRCRAVGGQARPPAPAGRGAARRSRSFRGARVDVADVAATGRSKRRGDGLCALRAHEIVGCRGVRGTAFLVELAKSQIRPKGDLHERAVRAPHIDLPFVALASRRLRFAGRRPTSAWQPPRLLRSPPARRVLSLDLSERVVVSGGGVRSREPTTDRAVAWREHRDTGAARQAHQVGSRLRVWARHR
jgi:hypothetical protein